MKPFVIWLLLSMNSEGSIYLHGQYWLSSACEKNRAVWTEKNRRANNGVYTRDYVCYKVELNPPPQPKEQ